MASLAEVEGVASCPAASRMAHFRVTTWGSSSTHRIFAIPASFGRPERAADRRAGGTYIAFILRPAIDACQICEKFTCFCRARGLEFGSPFPGTIDCFDRQGLYVGHQDHKVSSLFWRWP